MASEPVDDGVCAGSAPALVARAGRLVFTGSGRTPAEVLAALDAGEPVDPREARRPEAWAERVGAWALAPCACAPSTSGPRRASGRVRPTMVVPALSATAATL